jgi:hypothetical protein
LRKRSTEINPFAGARVREADLRGMEEIAVQKRQRDLFDTQLRSCAVESVADNWMM